MIRINAVGDVFLGDYTISLGFGIGSSVKKHGFAYHLEKVRANLGDADIVFGNLETVISDYGIEDSNIQSIICRGENGFVEVLKNGGFNALNIANNHVLQHGVGAFQDTINILKENDIDVIGILDENKFICRPVIKIIQGKRIGILGYSFVNENYHKDEILYAVGNIEYICKDIIRLKEETDHVIVSCHWGIEFIDKPSLNIQRMARKMAESGASVILGHHPHVVQGIERYGNSVIFYSLGNFLFDILWNRRARESIIAKIFFFDNKIEYEVVPIYINNKYQVVPMEMKQSIAYKDYIDDISRKIEINKYYDIEDRHFNYYVEANKILFINQLKKIYYTLKNIYRLDEKYVKYLIEKMYKYK